MKNRTNYTNSVALFFAILFTLAIAGCGHEDYVDTAKGKFFTVTIENISDNATLQPGALPNRTAPIGNGVWAVISGGDLFTLMKPADEGTSRLAEDCITSYKTAILSEEPFVKTHGEFVSPGGPDQDIAIFAGESTSFIVQAEPGDKLQIQTMFVQSNDWFYSFRNGGIDLFDGEIPINGDFTSELVLYDAGTEADEMPGIGELQKLDQDPTAINIGPDDPLPFVKDAMATHTTLVIPPTEAVLKITVATKNHSN